MEVPLAFFLFGSFEAQVADGGRISVGDTVAAKILAYLAYRRQFCARDEIVRACWGTHKVTGRDKLEDEAYQRQISNLRALFGSLGLAWQDYLLCQPNGLQLRDGTFSTDLVRFDELLRAGLNPDVEAAVRLTALQEADGLRRGYLLDGMHCEWIVAESGGARSEYSDRVQRLRREILQLHSPQAAAGLGIKHVAYCDGLFEVIPQLRSALSSASRQIILCGVSLHLTLPVVQDILLERLRSGVNVQTLLLDPESPRIVDYAEATANDAVTLRQEMTLSIRRLELLGAQATNLGGSRIDLFLFDRPLQGRMYVVDPESEQGRLFYFPYVDGTMPVRLPGYLWHRAAEAPFQTYFNQLESAASTAKPHQVPC